MKNHGVDLTGEVNLPSIDDFSTRAEFNEWKEEVSSFTNRYNLKYQFVTNPYGVTASKSRLLAIERRRRREQRVAKEEIERIKDIEVKHRGKPFATVEQRILHFSEPDVTGVHVPEDFDFKEVRSERRLLEIEDVGKRRTQPEYYHLRKERMKNNFISALEQAYNSEADELIDVLNSMSGTDFYFLYVGNEEFDFEDIHYKNEDVIGVQMEVEKINQLMDIIEKYYDDLHSSDLDIF